MNRLIHYIIFLLAIISCNILFINTAMADFTRYSLSNTALAQVRSTGGACIADNYGLAGTIYNPASVNFYRYPASPKFAFFVNPMGTVSLIRDRNELSADNNLEGIDWLNYTGIIFKGIGFSMPTFTAALLLTEPLKQSPQSAGKTTKEMFSGKDILDCNYSVLALKLKLAEQVAIGASGFLFTIRENDIIQRTQGTSYGVQINPNPRVSVGVVYYNFPELVSGYMLEHNRIIDETINVGINVKPYKNLSLNLDVYNVSEDNKKYTRELHFGVAAEPMGLMAIRAGLYREQDSQIDIYSFGLGFINTNIFYSTDNSFSFNDFALNYSIQFWQTSGQNYYHHYLTFFVRF